MPKAYPIDGTNTTHQRDDHESILVHRKKPHHRQKMKARQIVAANLTALMKNQRETDGPLASFQAIEDATARMGAKVGKSTVDRISKGTTPAELDNLEALARVFKLQVWQFLVPNLVPGAPPHMRTADKQDRLSPEALEIATQLDSIKDQDKREAAIAKAYMAAFRPQKPMPPVDPQQEDQPQAQPTGKRRSDR
jgi:hypothetical protein